MSTDWSIKYLRKRHLPRVPKIPSLGSFRHRVRLRFKSISDKEKRDFTKVRNDCLTLEEKNKKLKRQKESLDSKDS